MQALENGNVVIGENIWPNSYKGDRTLLGREAFDADDSTNVFKIGAVSKKIRYNDYWANFSDWYVGKALSIAGLARRQKGPS